MKNTIKKIILVLKIILAIALIALAIYFVVSADESDINSITRNEINLIEMMKGEN